MQTLATGKVLACWKHERGEACGRLNESKERMRKSSVAGEKYARCSTMKRGKRGGREKRREYGNKREIVESDRDREGDGDRRGRTRHRRTCHSL